MQKLFKGSVPDSAAKDTWDFQPLFTHIGGFLFGFFRGEQGVGSVVGLFVFVCLGCFVSNI